MKDIHLLFSFHVKTVDSSALFQANKFSIAPLELRASEASVIHDPYRVLIYSNKVGIDMDKYIHRQIQFNKNVEGTLMSDIL